MAKLLASPRLMSGLFTAGFAFMEKDKVCRAAKAGKLTEQLFGSVWNVAKWSAIPAVLAVCNPAGAAACSALALASFILPSIIPEVDVTENDGNGVLA